MYELYLIVKGMDPVKRAQIAFDFAKEHKDALEENQMEEDQTKMREIIFDLVGDFFMEPYKIRHYKIEGGDRKDTLSFSLIVDESPKEYEVEPEEFIPASKY